MRRTMAFWLASTAVCFAAAIHYPAPTNYVVDEAHVLSPQQIADMIGIAEQLAAGTGPEVAVCVVESLQGLMVEEYGIHLAEQWKVGKAGKDNGVILLVAVKDRKVRIEVGRGAEAILNDAKAGDILQRQIVPYLKKNQWDQGIRAGFDAIVTQIKET